MNELDFLKWTPNFCEANLEACGQQLLNDKNWFMVPLINGVEYKFLQKQQFVRFQGMIVDMPDPEYYLSRYEVQNETSNETTIRSGKFQEELDLKPNECLLEDSLNNVTSERQRLYCITDPMLNPWVADYLQEQKLSSIAEEDEMEESSSKRQKVQTVDACVVKIYEKLQSPFSLNDIVEVVGFTGFDACAESMAEAKEPNSELTIHAVAIRGLKHCNPLLPPKIKTDEVLHNAEVVRSRLSEVLREVLVGDHLASEYFLCHLISTVYARNLLLTLGCLPLNISSIPPGLEMASKISDLMKHLATKSHLLPMTLTNLNTDSLVPKKNYEDDRLTRARLQMSPHTHLILDETALSSGQLNATGVENVSALGKLVSEQKMDYDFKYYKLGFDYNNPVLILSEGKSLLPCRLEVKLHTTTPTVEEFEENIEKMWDSIQPSELDAIRRYLTAVRLSEYAIPEDVQEDIERDFVKIRQEDRKASAEDLHVLLVLSRLLSLSYGQKQLTRETWNKAVEMEKGRKERLAVPHRIRP